MARRSLSNTVEPKALRALVERSGLTQQRFATVLGVPPQTMSDMLSGRSRPTLAILNGARFVMLRLGHPVEINPVNDVMFQKLPRRR